MRPVSESPSATQAGSARILHVGPLPPPFGGVAAALQMILACRALHEFDCRVLNTSTGRATEVVGAKGLTPKRVLRRLGLALRIALRVLRERPAIVHFQCGSESAANLVADLLTMWIGRITGAGVILHLHVNPATASLPGRTRAGRWLFRLLVRPAHAIFTLTDRYREHLLHGALPQRVQVIPNMCDEALLELPLDRRQGTAEIRVIYIGRLSRTKGVADLLALAARFKGNAPPVRFDLAGLPSSTQDARLVNDLINRHGLDNVKRWGLVAGPDKRRLFDQADILILPSYGESFGIAAIEAMAAALPVVATSVEGLNSIVVDDQTGFLVEPGDVESMTQLLRRLATDEHLRRRLGNGGRERFLERYTTDKVGATIASAYHTIVSERGQPSRPRGAPFAR